jgi:hypothetical protein
MKIPFAFLVTLVPFFCQSQVVLKADGAGNTYELINSVLAPENEAVEHPECVHGSFGRHIAEVWDEDLKENVFEFYSHVTPDNDRCEKLDRQRVEIKTYEPLSKKEELLGTTLFENLKNSLRLLILKKLIIFLNSSLIYFISSF